ncbi:MAG: ribonucleoside-diphosphate reductase, adenosylcobalamin-dependent, partial [Halioglobus sp.]|nr:ribonucleoside-diphosphate reductase, adenosylcobalamin-dependent [Halioglobus sp.]
MSRITPLPASQPAAAGIPLQATSLDIWRQKYCLRDTDGKPLDRDIDATFQRVAHAIAEVEATPQLRRHWNEEFLWALRQGAIPA